MDDQKMIYVLQNSSSTYEIKYFRRTTEKVARFRVISRCLIR
jgi:hypothetical protein